MKVILPIVMSSIVFGIVCHTVEAGDSCPETCYDDSSFIGFCTDAAGNECGVNMIIDGKIVSSGLKTVNGCAHPNPNAGDNCTGSKVGPCS